jgi:hypothetical protein
LPPESAPAGVDRRDPEVLDVPLDEVLALGPGERVRPAPQGLQGEDDVLPHAELVDEPLRPSVLCRQRHPVPQCIRGAVDHDGTPAERDHAAVSSVGAGQQAGELGPA